MESFDSAASLLLPPVEFNDRLSNTFTLLLTVVAFKIVLGEKLPKCPYQTLADKYISAGLFILGLAGFEHTLVYCIATERFLFQQR